MFGLWRKRRSPDSKPQPKQGDAPASYAEWSIWFENFERGENDDRLLELSCQGKINWTSSTASLFATRATQTLHTRMETIRLTLQTHLQRCQSPADFGQAVINARRAFMLLSRYAALPCWPASLRRQLTDMLTETTTTLQKTLLTSSAADRTGQIAKILRDTPLDRPFDNAPQPGPSSTPSTSRRLLLP